MADVRSKSGVPDSEDFRSPDGTPIVIDVRAGNFTAYALDDASSVRAIGGAASTLTTKGDLLTYSTTTVRLPVGTNGYVVMADSAAAEGIKWAAIPGGGDMLLGTSQTVTALKTFDPATLAVKSASTGVTTLAATSSASNYTATFQAASGTVAYQADVHFIGTTSIALNRGSGAQSLTGITSIDGNAATVTNATLTTALTVNTGTVTLTGNVANTSALTLGAGASSISGTNTGDETNARIYNLLTTEKTTPTGADSVVLVDSADSNILKRFTWTNLNAALISDTAYNATTWNGVTTVAPSKNAVRDWIETLGSAAYTASTAYDVAGAAAAAQAASQPVDATLTALAAADWVANAVPIGTGANTLSQTAFAANTFPARASTGNLVAKTISDFAFTILDDADGSAVRTTIGLGSLATQSGTFSGTSSGTNTGDQTITLTGDVTGSGTGSFAATLATVNANVGSFGSSSVIPTFTVNGKGLITAASTATVTPAAIGAMAVPSGTLNYVAKFTGSGITIGNSIIQDNGTQVGIGASPTERFFVLSSDNTLATNILAVRANNLTVGVGIGYNTVRAIGTNGNNALYLDGQTTGALYLQNTATGAVKIGSTAPTAVPPFAAGVVVAPTKFQMVESRSNMTYRTPTTLLELETNTAAQTESTGSGIWGNVNKIGASLIQVTCGSSEGNEVNGQIITVENTNPRGASTTFLVGQSIFANTEAASGTHSSCWGANYVVRATGAGTKPAVLCGVEVDVIPDAGNSDTTDSYQYSAFWAAVDSVSSSNTARAGYIVRSKTGKWLYGFDANAPFKEYVASFQNTNSYAGGEASHGMLVSVATNNNSSCNIVDFRCNAAVTSKFVVDTQTGGSTGGVFLYVNGALKEVRVGATDSGGTGYRLLRVDN